MSQLSSFEELSRGGPFRFEGFLGRGGMGTVYRAWDERLARAVAIKVLRNTESETARLRFRREAKAAARLSHSNIVQVFDILERSEGDWIVMEWVDGKSLREIRGDGPLAIAETCRIARGVLRALEHAHELGVLHRDVKCENVLLRTDGAVKLADFGLAKLLDPGATALTSPGHLLGTPRAMSPEAVLGRPVDQRSDLFSVGVLLYELLTGHSPFAAPTLEATLDRVLRHPATRLASSHPFIPDQLADLVEALLEKDPQSRPKAAAEALATLESIPETSSDGSRKEIPPGGAATTRSSDDWIHSTTRGGTAHGGDLPREPPAPIPQSPGLIEGRYEVRGWIGRGGMGEIWQAYDLRLGRSVAIKQSRHSAWLDWEASREKLRDEAKILARLDHPSIVPIYDFVDEDESSWIVLEYIEGVTLQERMDAGGLPLGETLEIAQQIVDGLVVAHRVGVVHLDLKAENIMIPAAGGPVRILDFGIASSQMATFDGESPRSEGAPVVAPIAGAGTARVMSPEQVRGLEVDARSDLFSLGVLLYEMTTRTTPFGAETRGETFDRILRGTPTPLRSLAPETPAQLERLVEDLLHKEAARRPQRTEQLAERLKALAESLRLAPVKVMMVPAERGGLGEGWAPRQWPAPPLPPHPFPHLLPIRHPALLGGRGKELASLLELLEEPLRIVALTADSGVGKSSLLVAGLVPLLRDRGRLVSIDRDPGFAGLASRLLGDLIDGPSKPTTAQDFATSIERLHNAAQRAPVLIIDQVERLFEPGARSARDEMGRLLGSTVTQARWLLAYRIEFHGAVTAWLQELPARGARAGTLTEPSSFRAFHLRPLGSGSPAEAREAFLDALTKPLELKNPDGSPHFPWRFAPGSAEKLAEAFSTLRRRDPSSPLTSELQLVVAHGLESASEKIIDFPEAIAEQIVGLLEKHLQHTLDLLADATQRQMRARILLALREVVAASAGAEEREHGLLAADFAAALGEEGPFILERLCSAASRILVVRAWGGEEYVALSNEGLAPIVESWVEHEGYAEALNASGDLLVARRLVALKTALLEVDADAATRLTKSERRRVALHRDVLLWRKDQRLWWRSCEESWQRRRRRQQIQVALGTIAVFSLVAVFSMLARFASARAESIETIRSGVPTVALATLDAELRRDPSPSRHRELLAALKQRDLPMDVLESGLEGVPASDRARAVLRIAQFSLGWLEEQPEKSPLIANVVWALDKVPGRMAEHEGAARALRDRALAPLRALRQPPPAPAPEDPGWVLLPPTTRERGADGVAESPEEGPAHSVSVDAFRIQRHEVTNGEFRRLFPEHPGGEDRPAAFVTWYDAMTYSAWLGGRLPTEAEWEYAAAAGCVHAYCDATGQEASIDRVAWTARNAFDPRTGELGPQPVMRLEPNPMGLFDLYGNLFEWTSDWLAPYEERPAVNPSGPVSGQGRAVRGGSFWLGSRWATATARLAQEPSTRLEFLGFRPVMPPLGFVQIEEHE